MTAPAERTEAFPRRCHDVGPGLGADQLTCCIEVINPAFQVDIGLQRLAAAIVSRDAKVCVRLRAKLRLCVDAPRGGS